MTTGPHHTSVAHAAAPAQPIAGKPAHSRGEGDLLRDAFRRRAGHAVEQIAMSASLEALAQALEAATDFGAVASALSSSGIPKAVLDLDPLVDALARGATERDRLATQAGGLLSAVEAGRALGISRQAVDKRRRGGQLLAVKVAGDWRYPAIQIDVDGQVSRLLPAVLEDGANVGMTGWAMLDFLLAPDEALGGLTPLEHLRRDVADSGEVRRLLQAAKADAFG